MSPYLHVLVLAVPLAVVGGLVLSGVRRRVGVGNDLWAWAALATGLVAVGAVLVASTSPIGPWILSTVHRITEYPILQGWWIVGVWAVVAAAGLAGARRHDAPASAPAADVEEPGPGPTPVADAGGGGRVTVVDQASADRVRGRPPTSGTTGSGPVDGAGRRSGPRDGGRWWPAALGYLALSVALWWQVWSTHPTSVTTCGCGDTSLFTWFLEWPAYALSHGMNPLYSTYLFHPGGVNLLSNTAEVGLGIVLAPVTWAFGPDRHAERGPHPEPGPVGTGHVRAAAPLGVLGAGRLRRGASSTGSRPSWWSASPTPT